MARFGKIARLARRTQSPIDPCLRDGLTRRQFLLDPAFCHPRSAGSPNQPSRPHLSLFKANQGCFFADRWTCRQQLGDESPECKNLVTFQFNAQSHF
jgi:hypothetical protein